MGRCFPLSELGMALREARETKDFSLDDLQEKTKIQKRYLKAIEDGEFDRLPGQFYTRAFIKSYSEAVGLNANEIFETYKSEIPRSGSDLEALPPRQSRESVRASSSNQQWMKNVQYAVMVIVVLVIAVGVWFLAQYFVSGKNGEASPNSSNATTIKSPKDLGNGTKVKSGSGSATSSNQLAQSSANSTPSHSSSNAQSGATNTNTATKPKQQIKLTSSKGNNYTYTLSGTPQFVLDVSALKGKHSWVEVYNTNSSGKQYFYGNVKDNSGSAPVSFHQDLSSLKQVYVKVGDVQTATITINGQKLKVPSTPVFQQITIVYKK